MSRDPRVDPRPGDVLRVGRRHRARHVQGVHGDEVSWSNDGGPADALCPLESWKWWARHATILHTAEVPDAE